MMKPEVVYETKSEVEVILWSKIASVSIISMSTTVKYLQWYHPSLIKIIIGGIILPSRVKIIGPR